MNESTEINLQRYSAIHAIISALLGIWPEHQKYIKTRFKNDSTEFLGRTNEVAELALKLIDYELPRYCEDYKWVCNNFLEEQWYFQRQGEYRLKNFKEAEREIYSNEHYMHRYVRGMVMYQVLWKNHAQAIDIFRTSFLKKNKEFCNYLEVGPGHGLYFYFAAQNLTYRSLTGWDVSDSSIAATQRAMKKLGIEKTRFSLVHQDMLDADCPMNQFDAVVISEVLEHLEQPDLALKSLYKSMRKNGRIFINVPINSPAPDHIYLWRNTEEVAALIQACGFILEEEYYLPIADYSLEYCRKHAVDISCVIIGLKS